MEMETLVERAGPMLFAVLLLIGCGEMTGIQGNGERLWIDKAGLVLLPGDTVQLIALRQRSPGDQVLPTTEVGWSSTAPEVARIDDRGSVIGLTPGSVVITARSGGAVDTALVRVTAAQPSRTVRWQAVSVGAESTCAVDEGGRAYCWGADYFGTLGAGQRREWTTTYMPIRVDDEPIYKTVDVGGRHACGLTNSGAVTCWGSGLSLGVGGGAIEAPRLLEGHFKGVDAGLNHTCALGVDGYAYCWGLAAYGELGSGKAGIVAQEHPRRVNGEHTFSQLTVGDAISCGVSVVGDLLCWGSGAKAGFGNADDVVEPTPLEIDGIVERVSGEDHICAETNENVIYCWGPNRWMQILGGDGEWVYEPLLISADGSLTAIQAGVVSTCAAGSTSDIYCWGWNRDGALGIGEASEQLCGGVDSIPCEQEPARVAGGLRFATLSLGSRSSCGITVDAGLYCWGSNEFGQLGVGFPLESADTPVRVLDPFDL